MTHDLQLLGVDYRFAPIEVREELSFSPAEAAGLLADWKRGVASGCGGAVVSTCNRSEFYVTGPEGAGRALLETLRATRPRARALHEQCFRYSKSSAEAALHLFRVAAGLESKIPGDIHILSQVRKALDAAREAGTLTSLLELTFHSACRGARRIRRETGFCQGGASIGGAVARTLAKRFPGGVGRILVLGAGQAGLDIAAHLAKKRLGTLFFASRRREQAAGMASEFGGTAIDWASLDEFLDRADAVVAATSGRPACLEPDRLSSRSSPLLIIDAGVPRNADPAVRRIPGIALLDLDMLESEQRSVIDARLAHEPAAVAILGEELDRWRREVSRLEIEPAIKKLYQSADEIRRQLVAESASLDPDRLTQRLVRRLLNGPVRRLRQQVRSGVWPAPASAAAWLSPAALAPPARREATPPMETPTS